MWGYIITGIASFLAGFLVAYYVGKGIYERLQLNLQKVVPMVEELEKRALQRDHEINEISKQCDIMMDKVKKL